MSMTHFNLINKGYVKVTLPKKNIYIYIYLHFLLQEEYCLWLKLT